MLLVQQKTGPQCYGRDVAKNSGTMVLKTGATQRVNAAVRLGDLSHAYQSLVAAKVVDFGSHAGHDGHIAEKLLLLQTLRRQSDAEWL